MTLNLLSFGTAVPPNSASQETALEYAKGISCERAGQERVLAALYRKSGVEHRGSVLLGTTGEGTQELQEFLPPRSEQCLDGPSTEQRMQRYAEEAVGLATQSSRAALEAAGIEPKRITHLVTVSCSGFSAPGFDLELFNELPLPPDVARTHLGFMGCHGALNGLRTAQAYAAADPKAVVLLCATELCSLHYQYGWNPDRIVANSLFADGSAAVVCTAGSPKQSDGLTQLRLRSSGSFVIPNTADAMTWKIGNFGFEMTLSSQVPDLIGRHLAPWMDEWLGRQGVSRDEIAGWAVHPGGPRILAATAETLGLGLDAVATSARVLADHGNMSSPTLLFILDRMRHEGRTGPIVALGFGPGLTIEAALIDAA
ncbi:type III polyketide synthase [Stratiformator vulcanicus]|uniref:Alpha-pyrone synthesis polyketide synthase-like Pks18 n=1 Tax=Stratiformator vulcanicus TaxID=2527980 RepID=A0A517R4M7_9PLAN|nr:type III polyketide synthase [Stratiformator vulcanicus]QDT38821.1 Alpha-pyrone synthesis polyketide synthase-like Pks18 [Stratiformator vulcanicus]